MHTNFSKITILVSLTQIVLSSQMVKRQKKSIELQNGCFYIEGM